MCQFCFFFDISKYLTDKYFEIVWGYQPPKIDPPKINFLKGSTNISVDIDLFLCISFYISRYLTDKYFDILRGSLGTPNSLKINYFESLDLGCQFFDISRYLTDQYFDIVWGALPPKNPPNGPPKINFLSGLSYRASFY